MPELPEVETIAVGLAKRVTGDVIESVWLGQKPEPLKSPAREMVKVLESTRIDGIRRIGKHIVFELERNGAVEAPFKKVQMRFPVAKSKSAPRKRGGLKTLPAHAMPAAEASPDKGTQAKAQWIVHLGMTGRLQVCEPQSEIAKHTHAILKLASGRELRFVDPRRFGRLSVARDGDFDAEGVEPLEVDLDRFLALFRGRKTPIKSALLNQKLLRGVGNIYADESLFRANLRPRRRASTITRNQL